jgi:hypothetical protein
MVRISEVNCDRALLTADVCCIVDRARDKLISALEAKKFNNCRCAIRRYIFIRQKLCANRRGGSFTGRHSCL